MTKALGMKFIVHAAAVKITTAHETLRMHVYQGINYLNCLGLNDTLRHFLGGNRHCAA
jgi:hypothetical protein